MRMHLRIASFNFLLKRPQSADQLSLTILFKEKILYRKKFTFVIIVVFLFKHWNKCSLLAILKFFFSAIFAWLAIGETDGLVL